MRFQSGGCLHIESGKFPNFTPQLHWLGRIERRITAQKFPPEKMGETRLASERRLANRTDATRVYGNFSGVQSLTGG